MQNLSDVNEKKNSNELRTAVIKESKAGGQWCFKCNYSGAKPQNKVSLVRVCVITEVRNLPPTTIAA